MMWVNLTRCFRWSGDRLLAAGRATLSLTRCVICRLLRGVEINSRRLRKRIDGGLDR